MIAVYNMLLALAAVLAVPYYGAKVLFTGKYRHSIGPKLGFNPPHLYEGMRGTPRIWMHAVSVGEVTAAAPILAALRADFPEACLVLSTGTETGQDMAHRLIPEATAIIYYPLDIPRVVRKLIHLVRPDLFVLTETELWPNFLQACRDRRIGIVMVNGRFSGRSFQKYYRTRVFWRQILKYINNMGVISAIDADRARAIGMAPERIAILGNAKYDGLAARVSPRLREQTAGRLSLTAGQRVFVAGSTHDGEEAAVLKAFQRLLSVCPDFRLILVPRHVERSGNVVELVREAGFGAISLTQTDAGHPWNEEKVLVVDRIGELFKMYSLATVVYCGGSLVPKGGQNILEPAAWGKVVFYGPSMDDFTDERALLEAAGAGIAVRDGEDLAQKMLALLRDPDLLTRRGEAAARIVAANRGAARRHADLIRNALQTGAGRP